MIPVAVDDMACDFYGANCHKWLLAPIGSGFLTFSDRMLDRLEPLQVSWGYRHAEERLDEPDEFGCTPRTRFLEHEGTRDICPWLVIPDAIDFQNELGWDAIRQRIHELSAHCRRQFADRHGLKLTTPPDPNMHGAMTAYWWPANLHAETLRKLLWIGGSRQLSASGREGLTLRVSNHFYTTESEIDQLAELIPAMKRSALP